jgi:hypothetical protein
LNSLSNLYLLQNLKKLKYVMYVVLSLCPSHYPQAMRFGLLEQEMQKTNEEYQAAVERASTSNLTLRLDSFFYLLQSERLHKEITAVFRELTNAENNVF